MPHTEPRVGRSYEHFPDGFELHLLHRYLHTQSFVNIVEGGGGGGAGGGTQRTTRAKRAPLYASPAPPAVPEQERVIH